MSKPAHSFQVIPMRLATSNPHEESMFSTYLLWGVTLRLQSYVPFSKLLYVHIEKVSQSSSIVFKSSAWFSLCVGIFCDKEGIGGMFITMNDSYKTVICNLHKLLSCLEMDHGSSKTAKIQELLRAFGPQTTKTLPWTHCGHCSPLAPSIISGFQLWATFTPAFR